MAREKTSATAKTAIIGGAVAGCIDFQYEQPKKVNFIIDRFVL